MAERTNIGVGVSITLPFTDGWIEQELVNMENANNETDMIAIGKAIGYLIVFNFSPLILFRKEIQHLASGSLESNLLRQAAEDPPGAVFEPDGDFPGDQITRG